MNDIQRSTKTRAVKKLNFLKKSLQASCMCGMFKPVCHKTLARFRKEKFLAAQLWPELFQITARPKPVCQPIAVVGSTYLNLSPPEVVALCKSNTIRLVPEPKNQYDRNAIAVFASKKIGYVAKDSQATVTQHPGASWRYSGSSTTGFTIYLRPA